MWQRDDAPCHRHKTPPNNCRGVVSHRQPWFINILYASLHIIIVYFIESHLYPTCARNLSILCPVCQWRWQSRWRDSESRRTSHQLGSGYKLPIPLTGINPTILKTIPLFTAQSHYSQPHPTIHSPIPLFTPPSHYWSPIPLLYYNYNPINTLLVY